VSPGHTATEVTAAADHGTAEAAAPGGQAVPIGALRPGPTPRRATDEEHIRRLAETDSPLPPILVHRSTMQVIDGRHRLRAALLRGRDTIDVVFFDGSAERAFIRAVEENITHGLPLSLTERKAAATRIMAMRPEVSDRMIATYTGLAAGTVGMLRRCSTDEHERSNTREGVDGRRRPLDATQGRLRAVDLIAEHPGASLREIAKTAGVSLGTAHDVRSRLSRGEDPIPRGRRAGGSEPSPSRDRARAGSDACAAGTTMTAQIADDQAELPLLLERLAKDPALRLTDPGRRMLRLLFSSTVIADWPELADSVPPHRIEAIQKIAQQCAKDWDLLAQSLQRQTRSGH